MASPKIKKKAAEKASFMPRQGAIPCLVLLGLIFIIIALFVFFGFRSTS